MFNKKTLEEAEVAGKKVLVRVDFNVPLSEGTVTDDTRIQAALPTIQYLIEQGARVILMSHLGRPSGEGYEEKYSLEPARRVLSRILNKDVALLGSAADEATIAAIDAMQDGDVVILENTRFDKREKKNNPELAQELAALADVYVNDAFGTAHRAHASTAGVADYLPAYAGYLLAREVETLGDMLAEPVRPFVAVLGGSKVSDKFAVIDRLLDLCDTVIVGGGMCFTFLYAQGYAVGKSLLELDWVEPAKKLLKKAEENGVKLLLPVDCICADAFSADANISICGIDAIPEDLMGLDIGPTSNALFAEAIAQAKTIFWNGPMGVFEMEPYAKGTRAVADAIAANTEAASIVGGGDSVAAVKQFGVADKMTFISTGGGASMELVEGKTLPGVAALLDA